MQIHNAAPYGGPPIAMNANYSQTINSFAGGFLSATAKNTFAPGRENQLMRQLNNNMAATAEAADKGDCRRRHWVVVDYRPNAPVSAGYIDAAVYT